MLSSIDDTFGAGFIGAMVTMVLYGLTTLQTYFYFVTYPKDRFDTKVLVSATWILDTLHVGFVGHAMYHYLVTNYANPAALVFAHWTLLSSIALNVMIAVVVQSFFTIRIFHLCKLRLRWWLTSFIGLIVLAHFAFGMETVVLGFMKKRLDRLPEITLIAAMPFAIFAVLSDVFIAVALCVLLHGNRTGFKTTNTLVTTLIVYAINRCLLTSAVAIVEVIAFAISPNSLWFIAIDFVIGKLYANSLLATLNTRNALRSKTTSDLNSVHLSNLAFQSEGSDTRRGHVDIVTLPSERPTASSGSVRPSAEEGKKHEVPDEAFCT